jgi:thiosulfate/3-mercaptopyruvate sulfurtransferase
MPDYRHPEVLVSTDLAASHIDDPIVRLVEVDGDTKACEKGQIKNPEAWNWATQLHDNVQREIPNQKELEAPCNSSGIASKDTMILYGDNTNWFAAFVFWQFTLYGHREVSPIDVGRKKFELEGRPFTTEHPT